MAKKYSEENLAKSSADNKPVDAIKGIGPTYKEKLHEIGIKTTNDLMNRALKAENRIKLFSETDLSLVDLYEWAGMASLMKVNGIGPKYAKLLSEAGVENIGQLASQNSVMLARSLGISGVGDSPQKKSRKKEDDSEVSLIPSENTLELWIDEAKVLFGELGLQRLDFEDLTPATLQKLDFQVHDFLNFQRWGLFIKLGNFLQEKAVSKIKQLRGRQIIWEKVPDVEASYSELLEGGIDQEIITEYLAEIGEPREDIQAFISDIEQGKFDDFQLPNEFIFSEDELEFPVFLGVIGTYLSALGNVNSLPKSNMSLLNIDMLLEKINVILPEDQDIEITQEDIDAIRNTIFEKLLTSLKADIEGYGKEIDDLLNGIYNDLVAERFEELEKNTSVRLWRLDEMLEESLPNMDMACELVSLNHNPTAEEIRLAVQTSALLEKQCIAYGICLYFMAINNPRLEGPKLLKEEITKAKNTDFNSSLPKRDFVALPELLQESDKFKDTLIETCGSVKHTKEWRESEQVGFVLQQCGQQANVLLKDCKFKDILPPEESIVLLSGELKENNGETIIEVERLDFDALGKQSWLDYIMKHIFNYWYTEAFAIRSNRFIRFPETTREIIKIYGRG